MPCDSMAVTVELQLRTGKSVVRRLSITWPNVALATSIRALAQLGAGDLLRLRADCLLRRFTAARAGLRGKGPILLRECRQLNSYAHERDLMPEP